MSVPYMGNVLNGWTSITTVDIITQSVVDFETVETKVSVTLDCNFQPMPDFKVDKKVGEERTWKWWSIIVYEGQILNTGDIIVKDSKNYRIMSGSDWTQSGFQKYEAIEDYTVIVEDE